MNVYEAMQRRRSIRKFTPEPVSDHDVDTLLHAAMSAPSACNRTPWDFYVITAPDILAQIRSAAHYSNITAPMAIVVCGNLTRALPQQMAPYWIQDCSAATENLLLQAVEIGLGAVWCGIHPQPRAESKVAAALGLPEENIPLNIIWIGHPAEEQEPRDQYSEERVHYLR